MNPVRQDGIFLYTSERIWSREAFDILRWHWYEGFVVLELSWKLFVMLLASWKIPTGFIAVYCFLDDDVAIYIDFKFPKRNGCHFKKVWRGT